MFECQFPDTSMSPTELIIDGSSEYVMQADERGAFDLKPCFDMCDADPSCGGFVRERIVMDTGIGLSGEVKCIWYPILKNLADTANHEELPNSYNLLPNIYGDEQKDIPEEICKKTFYQKRPGE